MLMAFANRGSAPSPACLAQSVERQALNLMVVGSSPTVGVFAQFEIRQCNFNQLGKDPSPNYPPISFVRYRGVVVITSV